MMFWLGFVTGCVVTAILMIVLVVEWGSHAIRKGGNTAEGFGLWRVVKRLMGAAALQIVVGCSSSPTAPTPPVTPPPVVVIPPPVVTPPVTPPADDGLTRDPRFNLSFYQRLALGSAEGQMRPLRRQTLPPSIYLYTVDQLGNAVDALTLDTTAAALINVTGSLAGGKFGLAGIDRGTGPAGPNQIAVLWSPDAEGGACGAAIVGGRSMTLYYRVRACQCGGVVAPLTVKHEFGHVMGYYHTLDAQDLMSGLSVSPCDMNPSEREQFHFQVAYSRPVGSLDP